MKKIQPNILYKLFIICLFYFSKPLVFMSDFVIFRLNGNLSVQMKHCNEFRKKTWYIYSTCMLFLKEIKKNGIA